MRALLTAIMLLTIVSLSGQEVILNEKIKTSSVSFKIPYHEEIGLKLQKKDKTIKYIKFYGAGNITLLKIDEEMYINSVDTKWIEVPEGTTKIKIHFKGGRNNVLYIYKR